jgi:SMI1 / KNR4 family (SUKH-1)
MSQPPVWDVQRMRAVVAEWDEVLRAEVPAYARLLPEAEKRGSVLRPPATPDEVAAAEERLGVRLPPSYRSFLLVANGADAGGSSTG